MKRVTRNNKRNLRLRLINRPRESALVIRRPRRPSQSTLLRPGAV